MYVSKIMMRSVYFNEIFLFYLSNASDKRERITVEPRFSEVPRDWGNWFVISRIRYVI